MVIWPSTGWSRWNFHADLKTNSRGNVSQLHCDLSAEILREANLLEKPQSGVTFVAKLLLIYPSMLMNDIRMAPRQPFKPWGKTMWGERDRWLLAFKKGFLNLPVTYDPNCTPSWSNNPVIYEHTNIICMFFDHCHLISPCDFAKKKKKRIKLELVHPLICLYCIQWC